MSTAGGSKPPPKPTTPGARAKRGATEEVKSGVFVYPDGSKYEGQYIETKDGVYRQGKGTFVSAFGLTDDALLQLQVECLDHNQDPAQAVAGTRGCHTIMGMWERDKIVGPVEIRYASGASYVGDVSEQGMLHGRGVYRWPTGESYDGEFVNGAAHGKGRFTTKDGRVWDGTFSMNSGYGVTVLCDQRALE